MYVEITQEQRERYLKNDTFCPFCGSEHLNPGDIEINSGMAYQNVTCENCWMTWTDEYTLTGMTNVYQDNDPRADDEQGVGLA